MTPQADVALAPLTTMAVGGPARWFVDARTESDVCNALRWGNDRGLAIHVLGGGSNVVIADEGFDGLVIKVNVAGCDQTRTQGGVTFGVGAGEPWDAFVAATVTHACAGLECLSGIPGLVGGTPVQNVGAYGQDVSETIVHVHAVDRRTATPVSFSNAECSFGYRTSRFKRDDFNRYAVTRVDFALTPGGSPTLAYADVIRYFESAGVATPSVEEVRHATLEIRRRKGMVIEEGNPANHSCGSFFVNPVVSRQDLSRVETISAHDHVPHYVVDATTVKIPAAWLIERAGFPKGTTRGAVGISPFQAQAIVNRGGARAADIVALAREVRDAVSRVFQIVLIPEPVFVGFVDRF